MRKLTFLLTFFMLLGSVHLQAKEYAIKDIPMVHLQNRTRYVSNPDGILSSTAVTTMDSILYALEQKTGIQTLVVAVTGIEGGDCFDFAHRLGQETGVGQKERDNGLVILLSTDERCVQFATGYGLEGILPDAICKRIQNRYMLPYFKDNNWNAGMVAGIRAVNGYLDGSMENINNDESEDDPLEFIIIFFVIFGGFIGIGLYANWRKTRCPHCKKHKLQRLSSKVIDRSNGTKTEEVVYKCRNCGHILRRKERSRDENYKGPRGGGPFIGGMGGGFFGGHGGSGGGFSGGGGSSGGGGASGRWSTSSGAKRRRCS